MDIAELETEDVAVGTAEKCAGDTAVKVSFVGKPLHGLSPQHCQRLAEVSH